MVALSPPVHTLLVQIPICVWKCRRASTFCVNLICEIYRHICGSVVFLGKNREVSENSQKKERGKYRTLARKEDKERKGEGELH